MLRGADERMFHFLPKEVGINRSILSKVLTFIVFDCRYANFSDNRKGPGGANAR